MYMSIIVLIPLAAVFFRAFDNGWEAFWNAVTTPQAKAALELTISMSLVVAIINAVMGTLIAWVLVRDTFPGRGFINGIIDLPFALPTIVAGLVLVALYGPDSPFNVDIAYKKTGIVAALLLVTLPFVVRSVQPVLGEVEREMEEAAASLGAGPFLVFWKIVLPNILPAVAGGIGLSFARALGELGAIVLIAGNLPYDTEMASVYIFGLIEQDRPVSAAAVSLVLLAASLVSLIVLNALERWGLRHVR